MIRGIALEPDFQSADLVAGETFAGGQLEPELQTLKNSVF